MLSSPWPERSRKAINPIAQTTRLPRESLRIYLYAGGDCPSQSPLRLTLAGLLTPRLESGEPSHCSLYEDNNGRKKHALIFARSQRRGRPGFTPEFPIHRSIQKAIDHQRPWCQDNTSSEQGKGVCAGRPRREPAMKFCCKKRARKISGPLNQINGKA